MVTHGVVKYPGEVGSFGAEPYILHYGIDFTITLDYNWNKMSYQHLDLYECKARFFGAPPADAERLARVLHGLRDLLREPLLDLEPPRVHLRDARQFLEKSAAPASSRDESTRNVVAAGWLQASRLELALSMPEGAGGLALPTRRGSKAAARDRPS